jgi:2-dehydropantoate 2-reductase
MRYIIHGAGAIGSLTGGWLAAGGADVILVARSAHAEAINASGLTIQSKAGDQLIRRITAVTAPQQITPRGDDVIVLAVKSPQTAESVQTLREVFDQDTPFICLQNGVRNEETAAGRFRHVIGAMADFSATLLAPGVVSHTRNDILALGNYPLGSDDTLLKVAADFTAAGFSVSTHLNVMAVKWSKLLLNLNNATHAITNGYVQLTHALPEACEFMADVVEEGLRVLGKAGISVVEKDNPLDVAAYVSRLRHVTHDIERIRDAENLLVDLRTYPSTWVDLKNKRGETEVSYFNGEIVLLGEKHGVFTPYNSTLLNTVEWMAYERLLPGRYNLDDLRELVEQRRLEFYHADTETPAL